MAKKMTNPTKVVTGVNTAGLTQMYGNRKQVRTAARRSIPFP